MLKTGIEVSNSINLRSFRDASNGGVNVGDKVGSRKVKRYLSKVNSSRMHFLIAKVREVFTYWGKVFTQRPIFYHFDLERNILIETDVSGFAIIEILS